MKVRPQISTAAVLFSWYDSKKNRGQGSKAGWFGAFWTDGEDIWFFKTKLGYTMRDGTKVAYNYTSRPASCKHSKTPVPGRAISRTTGVHSKWVMRVADRIIPPPPEEIAPTVIEPQKEIGWELVDMDHWRKCRDLSCCSQDPEDERYVGKKGVYRNDDRGQLRFGS